MSFRDSGFPEELPPEALPPSDLTEAEQAEVDYVLSLEPAAVELYADRKLWELTGDQQYLDNLTEDASSLIYTEAEKGTVQMGPLIEGDLETEVERALTAMNQAGIDVDEELNERGAQEADDIRATRTAADEAFDILMFDASEYLATYKRAQDSANEALNDTLASTFGELVGWFGDPWDRMVSWLGDAGEALVSVFDMSDSAVVDLMTRYVDLQQEVGERIGQQALRGGGRE